MAPSPLDTAKIVEICRAHDAAMVGVFGSVARAKDRPDSDVETVWLTAMEDLPPLGEEIDSLLESPQ